MIQTPIKYCPSCGQTLALYMTHCGRCHAAQPLQTPTPIPLTPPVESNERPGVGLGVAAGVLVGFVFIVIGFVFCCTGIGIIIGAPMILVGAAGPFMGPFLRSNILKGVCPYCQGALSTQATSKAVTCYLCKQRVLVRNKMFVRIPTLTL